MFEVVRNSGLRKSSVESVQKPGEKWEISPHYGGELSGSARAFWK